MHSNNNSNDSTKTMQTPKQFKLGCNVL